MLFIVYKACFNQIWIMFSFSDAYHINTNTERVSAQNCHDWLRYCQKGNCGLHLTHIWIFFNPNFIHSRQIWSNLIYSMDIKILTQFQLKITKLLAKIAHKFHPYFGRLWPMEIEVVTEFQLKITLIAEAIDKKVILPKIWTIFWPSLDQIM